MDEPYRASRTLQHGLSLLGYDPFGALDGGTRYQQPALFLASVCAWEAAESAERVAVVAGAGHSLGEYAALVAAGALNFDDALGLVDERALAMADAAERQAGGMVAMLGGDEAAIRELATEIGLTLANDNAPGQLVLSGAIEAVARAEALASDRTGARAVRLDVSGAFHSPLMEPAAERLRRALDRIDVGTPSFPVYSNGSAEPFVDIRAELAANLLAPVRFRETLRALRGAGAEAFSEYGPGRVLSGMAKRTLRAEAVA